jgi:uncharacterized protein
VTKMVEGHLAKRLDSVNWQEIDEGLNHSGCALISQLLTSPECQALAALYAQEPPFRSRIVMQRHGFGNGEYKYFDYPLPDLVAELRTSVYPHLAPIANRWYEQMRLAPRFPPDHQDFIGRCHAAGQSRPTPLLVRYEYGDYNCLHQDLYGEHVFPLQMVVLLARPGQDFTGGELVMTEQRPRMQSRVEVLPLRQGDAAVFAVQQRPVIGGPGSYRVNMRHGVSRIRSGLRHSLGIIFHDAT